MYTYTYRILYMRVCVLYIIDTCVYAHVYICTYTCVCVLYMYVIYLAMSW